MNKLIDLVKSNFNWLFAILIFVYLIKCGSGDGDFKAFLEAAKLVGQGENPYHKWLLINEGNYCYYYYSPLWAVMLIPFSSLPNVVPNLLWLTFNVWLLYRIWQLVVLYFDELHFAKNELILVLVLTVLMSLRFVLYNFGMIQMTIFLLWGILESINLIQREKHILGGALLAFVINVKIMPIVLLPYLLYRGYIRTFIATFVFSLIYLIIPSIYIGWELNTQLLEQWWSVINPLNTEHLVETDLGLHSLTALIPNLLSSTDGQLSIKRNIFNLDIQTSVLILNIIRIGLVTFTLYFLKWPPFRKATSSLHKLYELSYLLLLIPLIFPHQQKYAYVLALPCQMYLAFFIVKFYNNRIGNLTKTRWFSIVGLCLLSFVLMTLTTDGIIGRELNNITQHLKLITFGALFLIIAISLADFKYLIADKGSDNH